MSARDLEGVRLHVHERGNSSLDGVIRLTRLAENDRPLVDVLCAMCADVAEIVDAAIVSAYVREGDVFTMLGNVGFPRSAVGSVRLRLGEGIVGFVAEKLRPVSVAVAPNDQHYKHVPGLGEERFPAMLAAPILRAGDAAGVLVLQRRERQEFTPGEVAIATAVGALFAFAIERAEERARREVAAAPHAAKLTGVPVVGGAALGRAVVLPTLASLARADDRPRSVPRTTIDEAVGALQRDLATARARLAAAEAPALRALDNLELIVQDQRFRSRLLDACGTPDLVAGLESLARDYARVPYRAAAGRTDLQQLLGERAREVEDLCVMLLAALESRRPIRVGSIAVAERLGAFAAVCAVARRPGAFVIEGPVEAGSPGAAIARAASIPLLASAGGVFTWIRPDDLVLVDADAGTVAVNPSATQVVGFRHRGR